MAKILIVHGISNQFLGESELLSHWYDALCDGLNRAGYSPLPKSSDCYCPFYGDLFRPEGRLSTRITPSEDDLISATEDEIKLLSVIWTNTAEAETSVPKPEAFGETLFRAPRIVERAINALAKSKYLADYLPLKFFGDLKQVVLYMNDSDVHEKIQERVLQQMGPETRIVIGHSLGSVVAYEAVCARPGKISTLITLGSPLGIRNVVFDKLTPRPSAMGVGQWPGQVERWTNIAATGDIVAAQKQLMPLFDRGVQDVVIDSGWDAHSSTRYLNSGQAGQAIARGL